MPQTLLTNRRSYLNKHIAQNDAGQTGAYPLIGAALAGVVWFRVKKTIETSVAGETHFLVRLPD